MDIYKKVTLISSKVGKRNSHSKKRKNTKPNIFNIPNNKNNKNSLESIDNIPNTKFTTTGFPYSYLKVQLHIHDEAQLDNSFLQTLGILGFRALIDQALREAYGIVGGLSFQIDVLNYEEEKAIAILRIPYQHLIVMKSALSLLYLYESHSCSIRILKSSSYPLFLKYSCRSWVPPSQ